MRPFVRALASYPPFACPLQLYILAWRSALREMAHSTILLIWLSVLSARCVAQMAAFQWDFSDNVDIREVLAQEDVAADELLKISW